MFTIIIITIPCTLLSLLDLVANIVNVWVFASQGLNSCVEISFFTIAVSDLLRVVFVQFENLCLNSYADTIDVPAVLLELFYVVVNWPLGCLIRATLHVTVYVTAERGLCILFPLKIKTLITRKTTVCVISGILILNALTLYPVYSTMYLSWNFYPKRNRTLLGLGFLRDRSEPLRLTYMLHVGLSLSGLCGLFLLTFLLVAQLYRRRTWRFKNSGQSEKQKDSLSSRDKRSAKMVIVVAVFYFIFFLPIVCSTLVAFFVPDFNFSGKYDAFIRISYGVALMALSVNSTINILIYFKMSTNYRETFRKLFNFSCHKIVVSVSVLDIDWNHVRVEDNNTTKTSIDDWLILPVNSKMAGSFNESHTIQLHISGTFEDITLDIFHWEVFSLVNNGIVCTLIGTLGLVANVINMAVFYRQGLNTSTNISLFSMAVSDIIRILCVEWANICFNPYIENLRTPILFDEIFYITGGWPVGCACRITLYITVFITAERCLCIVFPLTIKTLITYRQTRIFVVFIYSVHALTLAPEYSSIYLSWQFNKERNDTVLGVAFRANRSLTKGVTFMLHVILIIIGLLCLIFLTATLVIQLRRQTKWRMQNSGHNRQSGSLSNRDRKSIALVIVVATSVSVCYIPIASLSLVTVFVPDFYVGGKYFNVFRDSWAFAFLIGIINSSSNIIIYYKMNSKFRKTFEEMISTRRNANKQNRTSYA
ncbi:hypothetical protein Btru_059247 [Bulinus truncatus]|nr:hypothetical protein Btru_059247 [Bulinus truncatus]